MSDTPRDPAHVQTWRDADAAMSMARALWREVGTTPNAEVLQATFATVLINIKDQRKGPHTPAPSQAGQPRAAASARPAPTPAVEVPSCPACGGEMYDNRKNKKNPKAPDFRCKNNNCKDDKGYTTSLWVRDLKKNTEYAQAHAGAKDIRDRLDEFAEKPAALQDEGDDELPF